MFKPGLRHLKGMKFLAALSAALLLCNAISLLPVFAASSPAPKGQQASSDFCIPIPFILQCPTPTPTANPNPTNTPTGSATVTPTTPTSPSNTPTPLSATSSFTLSATQIIGTDAHLQLLPDHHYPVLTFSAVTIYGMKITHLNLTISASGVVTGTNAAIKTSLFQDLTTALGSFANKADLLILTVGGTVPTLIMNHVTLQVDRYIDMQSNTINGLAVNIG
jgi:hypothetical protein